MDGERKRHMTRGQAAAQAEKKRRKAQKKRTINGFQPRDNVIRPNDIIVNPALGKISIPGDHEVKIEPKEEPVEAEVMEQSFFSIGIPSVSFQPSLKKSRSLERIKTGGSNGHLLKPFNNPNKDLVGDADIALVSQADARVVSGTGNTSVEHFKLLKKEANQWKETSLELQKQLSEANLKASELTIRLGEAEREAQKLKNEVEENAMASSDFTKALAYSQLKCAKLEKEVAQLKRTSKNKDRMRRKENDSRKQLLKRNKKLNDLATHWKKQFERKAKELNFRASQQLVISNELTREKLKNKTAEKKLKKSQLKALELMVAVIRSREEKQQLMQKVNVLEWMVNPDNLFEAQAPHDSIPDSSPQPLTETSKISPPSAYAPVSKSFLLSAPNILAPDTQHGSLFCNVLKILDARSHEPGTKVPMLKPSDILNYRLVCKAWKAGVDKFLEEEEHSRICMILRHGSSSFPLNDTFLMELGAEVNPIPSRSLAWYPTSRISNKSKVDHSKALEQIGKFLRKFGKHVWRFESVFTGNKSEFTTDYERYSLLACLSLMPNLKELRLRSCFQLHPYEIDAAKVKFPRLKHLKTLIFKDCSHVLVKAALLANPGLTKLCLKTENDKYVGNDWRGVKLDNLQELEISSKLLKSLNSVSWKNVTTLSIAVNDKNEGLDTLLGCLKVFRQSLTTLEVAPISYNMIQTDFSFKMNLNKFTFRLLWKGQKPSLDFLMGLQNLKYLTIQLDIYGTEWNDVKNGKDIDTGKVRLFECIRDPRKSNIWKFFPQLEMVTVLWRNIFQQDSRRWQLGRTVTRGMISQRE